MTETEVSEISEVEIEVADLLADYGLDDAEAEDAARRIVDLLIDALDILTQGD